MISVIKIATYILKVNKQTKLQVKKDVDHQNCEYKKLQPSRVSYGFFVFGIYSLIFQLF